ncbi:MAG: hypothetical protein LGB55_07065 [Sulfurovum sp.]|nr:hypothetical protein [Sulfurovum sp.]
MDIYLLLFLLIVLVGSITVMAYYLKEKKEELDTIRRGFCPRCKQKGIELSDQRLGGCSGTKIVNFTCLECGYHNSFSVESNDRCGGGS